MFALLTLSALLAGQTASSPPPSAPRPPAPPEIRREVRVVTTGGPGGRGGAWRDMDRNNDGFVSREEFTGPTTDAFRILDADSDGRLAPEEFAAGRAAARVILGGARAPGMEGPGMDRPGGPRDIRILRHGPEAGPDFDALELEGPESEPGDLDTDHDGKVSEVEFLAPLRAAFQRMDADRSGALEAGEHGDGAAVRVVTRRGPLHQ